MNMLISLFLISAVSNTNILCLPYFPVQESQTL